MKKSLDKAWGLVRKYKEATKIPPSKRVSRPRSKAQFKTDPTQPMLTEHKYPTSKSQVQSSTKKASSKRKRR